MVDAVPESKYEPMSDRSKLAWIFGFGVWVVTMPIQLFEFTSRGETTSFHVYDLYNFLYAAAKEPGRALTETPVFVLMLFMAAIACIHPFFSSLVGRAIAYLLTMRQSRDDKADAISTGPDQGL